VDPLQLKEEIMKVRKNSLRMCIENQANQPAQCQGYEPIQDGRKGYSTSIARKGRETSRKSEESLVFQLKIPGRPSV
jgi:hypothetical protein